MNRSAPIARSFLIYLAVALAFLAIGSLLYGFWTTLARLYLWLCAVALIDIVAGFIQILTNRSSVADRVLLNSFFISLREIPLTKRLSLIFQTVMDVLVRSIFWPTQILFQWSLAAAGNSALQMASANGMRIKSFKPLAKALCIFAVTLAYLLIFTRLTDPVAPIHRTYAILFLVGTIVFLTEVMIYPIENQIRVFGTKAYAIRSFLVVTMLSFFSLAFVLHVAGRVLFGTADTFASVMIEILTFGFVDTRIDDARDRLIALIAGGHIDFVLASDMYRSLLTLGTIKLLCSLLFYYGCVKRALKPIFSTSSFERTADENKAGLVSCATFNDFANGALYFDEANSKSSVRRQLEMKQQLFEGAFDGALETTGRFARARRRELDLDDSGPLKERERWLLITLFCFSSLPPISQYRFLMWSIGRDFVLPADVAHLSGAIMLGHGVAEARAMVLYLLAELDAGERGEPASEAAVTRGREVLVRLFQSWPNDPMTTDVKRAKAEGGAIPDLVGQLIVADARRQAVMLSVRGSSIFQATSPEQDERLFVRKLDSETGLLDLLDVIGPIAPGALDSVDIFYLVSGWAFSAEAARPQAQPAVSGLPLGEGEAEQAFNRLTIEPTMLDPSLYEGVFE